jgi:hypothetical protein
MPRTMATSFMAAAQGQCTHFARTNKNNYVNQRILNINGEKIELIVKMEIRSQKNVKDDYKEMTKSKMKA